MRATTYSDRSIRIEGTEQEVAALHRMLAGVGFVGCGRDGVPLFAEKFDAIEPQPDPHLMQHFTPTPPSVAKYSREGRAISDDPFAEMKEGSGISIYVEHICGYDYTPAEYSRRAAQLRDMGFTCMRSPRGTDGRYWEAWYLPGLWAAEGALKRAKDLPQALNLIAREIRPGSISAVNQRMALCID